MATKDDKALGLAEDNEKRIEKLEKRIKELENQLFAVTKKTEQNHSDLLLLDSSVGDVSARMKAGFADQDQKRAQELATRDKSIQGLQWKTADIDKRLVKGLADSKSEMTKLFEQNRKDDAEARKKIVDWIKDIHKIAEKTEKDAKSLKKESDALKKILDGLARKIEWVMRLVK